MKKILLLLSLLFSVACSHQTINNVAQENTQASQRKLSSEEFGIDWTRFISDELMPSFGKFSTEIVEKIQRRAVILLTTQEKINLKIPIQQIAFANFRHAGVFYVATIPGIIVDQNNVVVKTDHIVEKIIFSEKHWAAKIRKETQSIEAHSELSIFLKAGHGIQLIVNQDTKEKLKVIKTLNEPIVYSVEAVRSELHPTIGFFPYALGPNFALARRIESSTERNIQHLDDPDRKIVSNHLDFKNTKSRIRYVSDPKDAVLVSSILKSNEDQRHTAYEIVTNNCTNGIFNILDSSLIYKNNKIDTERIRNAVIKFSQNDLKQILEYLKQQKFKAAQQGTALSAGLDETIDVISKYSERATLKTEIPNDFLTTIPAFIGGHLQARGLIP